DRFRTTREPRAEAVLSLRNGSFSTLEHIDLDAHAEIGRTTGRASADLALGPHRTPVHLDASLPIPTRRKGPIAAHLVTHNLLLRDLPVRGLERRGIKDGVV